MIPEPPPSARLRVSLFAGMAERAGRRQIELPWTGGTVADLQAAVRAACPAVGPLLERSAIAIGDRYATAGEAVVVGDEVAIIPPVSGV